MSFAQDAGYTPVSIATLVDNLRVEINSRFGTTYTAETFVGTNWYKFAYAVLQRVQTNETKTAEIFQKLQEYIATTNDRISRPTVSHPGLVDAFDAQGIVVSVKPAAEADAGEISLCALLDVASAGTRAAGTITITNVANLLSGTPDVVSVAGVSFTAQAGAATLGTATFRAATDVTATALSLATQINAHATTSALVSATSALGVVTITAIDRGTAGNSIALGYTNNDANVGATKSGTTLTGGTASTAAFDELRTQVVTLLSQYIVAGMVTQGDEHEDVTLSNGQEFTYRFYLPTEIPVLLRLTVDISENNLAVVPTDTVIRQTIFDQVNERYRLGLNFEPQRYFNLEDASWAASVVLEWSSNAGGLWHSTVYDADFDEVFTFDLEDIAVVGL